MRIDAIKLNPFVGLEKIGEASAATAVPLPVPLGISGDSSISSASTPLYKISAAIKRPLLPSPEPHYMLELLRVERRMTEILHQEGRQLESEINSDLKRLETFNREKIEMLRSHAKELKSKEQWAAWQAVAEYVSYSCTFALGASFFFSGVGTAPGLFLMASGIIGLVNRVGADSTAWRWTASWIEANHQKQVHIAEKIENGLSAAAIALSIAGACTAYHANVFAELALNNREVLLDKAIQVLSVAGAGLSITQKAGEGYHHSNMLSLQADMKRINAKNTALRAEISMNTAEIQKMFKLSEEIDAVVKAAIASSTV